MKRKHEGILAGIHLFVVVMFVVFFLPYDLSFSGYYMMWAHGTSMMPTYDYSNVVMCYTPAEGTVEPGDVVTLLLPGPGERIPGTHEYTTEMKRVCHRVIRRYVEGNTTMIQTKGDGNAEPDDPVPESNILGVVYYQLPLTEFSLLFLALFAAMVVEAAAYLYILIKKDREAKK